MKINKLIASTLLSLGLVTAASVARADSTVSIGGHTYAVVYITGSTAARANVFNAVTASSGVVFDSAPTFQTQNGVAPTGSTGSYNEYGTIGGAYYLLSFSWTGSEAGLYAIEHKSVGEPNPYDDKLYNGTNAAGVLPGTPNPTTFVDPTTPSGPYDTAQADLAMADTGQAVSLSSPPAYPALVDYGVVGVVTFEWCKGANSAADQSWIDMTNVTDWQMNYALGGVQAASYITGNSNDLDSVYMIGRNIGSGTHVNTMLVTQHGVRNQVDQFAPANCGYTNGTLQIGNTSVTLASAGGLVDIGNDGFDSGSGVAGTLSMDEHGTTDTFGQIICIGYAGISDANSAISHGAAKMSDDGVMESDASIITGQYPFWGHEHLYGEVTEDSAVQTVAQAIAGSAGNDNLGPTSGASGALEAKGQLGGDEPESQWASTQSSIIDPKAMLCNKPSDSGYPSQF